MKVIGRLAMLVDGWEIRRIVRMLKKKMETYFPRWHFFLSYSFDELFHYKGISGKQDKIK